MIARLTLVLVALCTPGLARAARQQGDGQVPGLPRGGWWRRRSRGRRS